MAIENMDDTWRESPWPTDPALEVDLEDYLAPVPDDGIPDAEVADRVLARVRRLDRKIREVDEFVQARKAALDAWAHDRSMVMVDERDRAEQHLEGWARAVHEATGQVTWKLPAGTITLRPGQVRVLYVDDRTIGDTLAEAGHTALVEETTVRKVPKQGIKNVAVPGEVVESVPEGRIVSVKGWEVREAVVREPDESTGEMIDTVLPGVLLEVPTRRVFKASPR
jgi:hypothetical protein